MSGRENGEILAGMALGWADITNATVPMLDVVPVHEADCPGPGVVELGKAVSRKLRAVFGRPKQRFRVSIVITGSVKGTEIFSREEARYLWDMPLVSGLYRGN